MNKFAKKTMSGIIASAMAIASCATAFAAGSCDRSTHYQYIGPAVVGNLTSGGVHVRTGPSTSYSHVGYLYNGNLIDMYSDTRDEIGWTHVHGKHIGFMSDRYITGEEPASLSRGISGPLDENPMVEEPA